MSMQLPERPPEQFTRTYENRFTHTLTRAEGHVCFEEEEARRQLIKCREKFPSDRYRPVATFAVDRNADGEVLRITKLE